jgi:hypothetical protein
MSGRSADVAPRLVARLPVRGRPNRITGPPSHAGDGLGNREARSSLHRRQIILDEFLLRNSDRLVTRRRELVAAQSRASHCHAI